MSRIEIFNPKQIREELELRIRKLKESGDAPISRDPLQDDLRNARMWMEFHGIHYHEMLVNAEDLPAILCLHAQVLQMRYHHAMDLAHKLSEMAATQPQVVALEKWMAQQVTEHVGKIGGEVVRMSTGVVMGPEIANPQGEPGVAVSVENQNAQVRDEDYEEQSAGKLAECQINDARR